MNVQIPTLKAKDKPDLGSFQWDDALLLEDQLNEEERMIRDSARAYAQEKLQPRVTEAYANETSDPSIFQEMGEMGLLGVTVPEQYGGLGSSYVTDYEGQEKWEDAIKCGLNPRQEKIFYGPLRPAIRIPTT